MPSVSIGDTRLFVQIQGEGAPLLLVHGFPLDHTMWQAQIDEFSRDYQVIAPDLRGFGQSDPPSVPLSMEQHADDMAQLLSVLKIHEPVTFCGLSMGGYVAWQFCVRHMPRVHRLIVADTRALPDSPEVAAGRIKTARTVLDEGVGLIANAMLPRLFPADLVKSRPTFVESTFQVMMSTRPETVAGALLGMAERPDMSTRLHEITVPTLVVCGELDAISPAKEMRGIAGDLPQGKYVEIAGAGHMSPMEKPTEFNLAVREFLRG